MHFLSYIFCSFPRSFYNKNDSINIPLIFGENRGRREYNFYYSKLFSIRISKTISEVKNKLYDRSSKKKRHTPRDEDVKKGAKTLYEINLCRGRRHHLTFCCLLPQTWASIDGPINSYPSLTMIGRIGRQPKTGLVSLLNLL